MTTTTVSINNTRVSMRKLAAVHGWVIESDDHHDMFVRGTLKAHTSWSSSNPDGTTGRFYSAFLIDLTVDGQDLACIVDEGGVAKARGWLKAAV
jgi:hypothetical protein